MKAAFFSPSSPPLQYLQDKQQQPQQTPYLPVAYIWEGISASRRARDLFLRSNWGIIEFPNPLVHTTGVMAASGPHIKS